MLSPDEVRFLAILVQKGHLPKEAAERVFGADRAAQDPGAARTLEMLLPRLGLMAAERLAFLRRTGGEDVPAVPGYDYVRSAGFGGTSLVFRARESATGRDVALKIMHRELHGDATQKRRFIQEARLLMELDAPNIVKGLRIGRVKDRDGLERLVFIMEWVEGRTLLELLRGGKEFDEDLALYIILQAAQALKHLHAKGILHRDVKPDNILFGQDNRVKLIDLGFASAAGDAPAAEEGDTTLGTAAYMSPEQARGLGDLDVRSDIYSLGATLFQIMVGSLPFSGAGTSEQLAARILEALSSKELQSRRISPHMNYFIRKMMEQDRDFRYRDMDDLIGDIETQIRGKKSLSFRAEDAEEGLLDLSGEAGAPPDADPKQPPRFPPRRRRR